MTPVTSLESPLKFCPDCGHIRGYHFENGCHSTKKSSDTLIVGCDCPVTFNQLTTGVVVVPPTAPEGTEGGTLQNLIRDLSDPDPCHYDHHGYCQAHSWLQDGECPHARAQRLLSTGKLEELT